jgi:hypothetical protein
MRETAIAGVRPWERIGTARAVESRDNAADNNFTVSGSKQLGR